MNVVITAMDASTPQCVLLAEHMRLRQRKAELALELDKLRSDLSALTEKQHVLSTEYHALTDATTKQVQMYLTEHDALQTHIVLLMDDIMDRECAHWDATRQLNAIPEIRNAGHIIPTIPMEVWLIVVFGFLGKHVYRQRVFDPNGYNQGAFHMYASHHIQFRPWKVNRFFNSIWNAVPLRNRVADMYRTLHDKSTTLLNIRKSVKTRFISLVDEVCTVETIHDGNIIYRSLNFIGKIFITPLLNRLDEVNMVKLYESNCRIHYLTADASIVTMRGEFLYIRDSNKVTVLDEKNYIRHTIDTTSHLLTVQSIPTLENPTGFQTLVVEHQTLYLFDSSGRTPLATFPYTPNALLFHDNRIYVNHYTTNDDDRTYLQHIDVYNAKSMGHVCHAAFKIWGPYDPAWSRFSMTLGGILVLSDSRYDSLFVDTRTMTPMFNHHRKNGCFADGHFIYTKSESRIVRYA